MMFGFLKRRVLKEHMKIVAQNYKALSYCQAFLPPEQVSEFRREVADVQRTWSPGKELDDGQFRQMWKMNKVLRRTYDHSPARNAGMNHFEKEFQPLLGWDDYFSEHL